MLIIRDLIVHGDDIISPFINSQLPFPFHFSHPHPKHHILNFIVAQNCSPLPFIPPVFHFDCNFFSYWILQALTHLLLFFSLYFIQTLLVLWDLNFLLVCHPLLASFHLPSRLFLTPCLITWTSLSPASLMPFSFLSAKWATRTFHLGSVQQTTLLSSTLVFVPVRENPQNHKN